MKSRLRLVTYNVHKCIGGLDRRYAPHRVYAAIEAHEPDILLLQEVDDGAARSNQDRQVDLLGDLLGLRHRAWFPNVTLRGGGAYGNAIISRFPLTESNNIDLTIAGRKRRSVLHARCRVRLPHATHSRTVHLFDLHLGLSAAERRRQLERFLASLPFARLHHRTPIVVAGDFNDVWGTLGTQFLVPAGFRSIAGTIATFPAYAPVRPLDAVYVRGDVVLEGLVRPRSSTARQASDHLPLVADLRFDD